MSCFYGAAAELLSGADVINDVGEFSGTFSMWFLRIVGVGLLVYSWLIGGYFCEQFILRSQVKVCNAGLDVMDNLF